MAPDAAFSSFVSAQDGLRLHVRSQGPRHTGTLPIVCLPGLARTATDFETLASAFAGPLPPDIEPAKSWRPRRVVGLDSRGRGKSDYDRDPANYNVQVELADLLAVLTALGISRAVFIGTSRGGILTMLLAAARPTIIAGCVLNDIGPVIEPAGLMRIKSYVGKLPQPASFHEGADILRRLFAGQFPKLTDDDWVAFARRTFKDEGGRIDADYDAGLAVNLKGIKAEAPLPALWNAFEALAGVPVLVIRGGNSDLLSVPTVEAMRARHGGLEVIEVPDQGHAPILAGSEMIGRIAQFVANVG
jgi:pimeloyl-ACP methyl ester carboxylesterase